MRYRDLMSEGEAAAKSYHVYHGSPYPNIQAFRLHDLRHRTGTPGTLSFTTSIETAKIYGPHVYEAEVQGVFGDYRNPDDVEKNFAWRWPQREQALRAWYKDDPEKQTALLQRAAVKDRQEIANGNYAMWENVGLWRAMDWDGAWFFESGSHNLVVGNIDRVKLIGRAEGQTLGEGVVGPYTGTGSLWHGTDVMALAAILLADALTKSIDTNNPAGASLTYDEKMAWSFADRASYIFMNNHYYNLDNWPHGEPPLTGAVLEFDADRLRQSYRLIAYRDDEQWDVFEDDEKEVRVIGDQIAPVSRFLTSFWFNPKDIPWFTTYLHLPYAKHVEGWKDPEGVARFLANLPRHPKFRR